MSVMFGMCGNLRRHHVCGLYITPSTIRLSNYPLAIQTPESKIMARRQKSGSLRYRIWPPHTITDSAIYRKPPRNTITGITLTLNGQQP